MKNKDRLIYIIIYIILLIVLILFTTECYNAENNIKEISRTSGMVYDTEVNIVEPTNYNIKEISRTSGRVYDTEVNIVEPTNYNTLQLNEIDSTLPRLDITLDDNYLLSREYISAKISLSNTDNYNFSNKLGKIKVHGNCTAVQDKKPFNIKFNNEQSILGSNPEKKWILLANALDITSIHNYITYDLYNYVTPDDYFTPMCKFIDLYINERYIGIYCIVDKIDSSNGRVNISNKHNNNPEKVDYLIEQEKRLKSQEPDGENKYWFWLDNEDIMLAIRNIDKEMITSKELQYIKGYIEEVYQALVEKDWENIQELIDIESFMYYFLVVDMVRNYDSTHSSIWMVKEHDEKLKIATIWDMDLTFGSGGSFYPTGSILDKNWIYNKLIEVPEFKEMYVDKYNDIKDDCINHVNLQIEYIYNKYQKELENEYNNWDKAECTWNIPEYNNISYNEQIDRMKWWFMEQQKNLEVQYNEL